MLCFYVYMTDLAYRRSGSLTMPNSVSNLKYRHIAALAFRFFTRWSSGTADAFFSKVSSLVSMFCCSRAPDFHSCLCTWVRAHAHAMYRATTILLSTTNFCDTDIELQQNRNTTVISQYRPALHMSMTQLKKSRNFQNRTLFNQVYVLCSVEYSLHYIYVVSHPLPSLLLFWVFRYTHAKLRTF